MIKHIREIILADDIYKGVVKDHLKEQREKELKKELLRNISKLVASVIGILFTLYFLGFLVVCGAIASGCDGSDLLSQHYQDIVGFIIK